MSATLSLGFLEGKVITGTSTPWRLLLQADETGGGLGDAWTLQSQPVVGESRTTGGEHAGLHPTPTGFRSLGRKGTEKYFFLHFLSNQMLYNWCSFLSNMTPWRDALVPFFS